MGTLWQDMRYGFRILVRNPGFSFVVVALMAIGVGTNTAVFSILNACLIRPLPYEEPDRIVVLRGRDLQGTGTAVSYPDYLDWCRQSECFDEIGCYRFGDGPMNIISAHGAEPCFGGLVSSSFFRIFGVRPAAGRLLAEEDDHPAAAPVVVISHAFWRRHFGADPNAIGKPIGLLGFDWTIIGVTNPGFQYPPYGQEPADIWIAAGFTERDGDRGSRGLNVLGRLKADVSIQQAQAEMDTVCARLAAEHASTNAGWSAHTEVLQDRIAGKKERALLITMGAVVFVFMLTCTNVAGLFFARGVTREREMAVRSALGGTRTRLMRLMLVENVILAQLGGGLGVLGATWAIKLLTRTDMIASMLLPVGFFRLDVYVLGFALAISVLAVPLFGLLPSICCSSFSLARTLATGGRTVFGSRGRNAAHTGLVAGQITFTIVLLVAAGLLIRSLANVITADPGFNPENVLAMDFQLPVPKYADEKAKLAFYKQFHEQLGAIPGIDKAGLAWPLFEGWNWWFYVEGESTPAPDQATRAKYKAVSPGYFGAMGIHLLKGRYFDERDHIDSKSVAIVDETLAKRYWPDGDPIGRRIQAKKGPDPNAPWLEIIGVVGHIKNDGVEASSKMQVYRPLFQEVRHGGGSIVLRTKADPKDFVAAVKDAAYRIDQQQLVSNARTLDEILWGHSTTRRFITCLLSVFAGIALILSAVGIYAINRYSTSRRTQEFGIRMALGADKNDVLKLVLRKSLMPVLIGAGVGLVGTLAVAHVLSSLLFELSPWDPATYMAVVLLLAGVALLASYIPARRAAKVDPMVALRYE
ncbi:MAG: ABC transporter permease [Phycisphaerae bacterium]|nr:ABC transporter permease [Phycisphaerae bacterium]